MAEDTRSSGTDDVHSAQQSSPQGLVIANPEILEITTDSQINIIEQPEYDEQEESVYQSPESSPSNTELIASPDYDTEISNSDFNSDDDTIDIEFENSFEAYLADTTFDDEASNES